MPVFTPIPADDLELLELNGYDLNDGSVWDLEGMDFTPAEPQTDWVGGPDTEGSVPVDEEKWSNAELQLRMRVVQQATPEAAMDKIRELAGVLSESFRTEGGLPLLWTPGDSSRATTWYVLRGFINGVPITVQGDDYGWLSNAPVVNVRLMMRPFGYGAEVTSSTTTSSLPLITKEIIDVAGDVAAEGVLIVGDNATKNRDHVEWGVEALDSASGPALYTDASGFSAQASSSSTRSGSISTNIRRVTLNTAGYQSCFGWDGITNVGRFRVRVRIYCTGLNDAVTARLAYRSGDGSLSYSQPINNLNGANWQEFDFGVIDLRKKVAGTQSSDLRVEAKGTGTFDGDALYLIPVSRGYGKARADARSAQAAVTAYNARDDFSQAAGNLNGVTAPTGGNWATAGSATDLAIHADDYVYRATVSDAGMRRGIVGSSITDQLVAATFACSGGEPMMGVIARYVDASNYLALGFGNGGRTFEVFKVIAGVTTFLGYSAGATLVTSTALTVDSQGQWAAFYGGKVASGQDADLATGGTLATGKGGIFDWNAVATPSIRTYDNFSFIALSSAHALNSGRTIEFRGARTSPPAVRYNSAGTILGEPPVYRGSRFYIPHSGQSDKVARVAVKARRSDVDATAEIAPTDSTTVVVKHTPRFLTPR